MISLTRTGPVFLDWLRDYVTTWIVRTIFLCDRYCGADIRYARIAKELTSVGRDCLFDDGKSLQRSNPCTHRAPHEPLHSSSGERVEEGRHIPRLN